VASTRKAKIEGGTGLSSVDLRDPESVWIDEGGRSLGFFCQKKPVRVDGDLIQELKNVSARLDGKNLRLCLHESPDAAFHEMIILEHRSNYYRPHKHLVKGESYHIMEGSQGVFIFDEDGAVLDACVLEPQGNCIYRVGPNMYHAVMPLTDLIIYHESKPGPFVREGDSVFPYWAPDGTDLQQAAKFIDQLKQRLGSW